MFISFIEFLLLNIYLGSIIFISCSIIFLLLICYKIKKRATINIFLITVCQLLSSILLSMLIWRLWPFKADIMIGFIFLPGLIAELITILLFYFYQTKKSNRNKIKND